MGWLWGSKDSGKDPTKNLQPDLKEFLNKQDTRPYLTAEESKTTITPDPEPQRTSNTTKEQAPEDRPLPKQSLFQDGRYKDLWKTYIPQEQDVVVTSTAAERVVTAKKNRREQLHRVALENCAFEEELKMNCFTTGTAANRARATMTMCNQETKAFNRCYQLQAKFLQALGYMSDPSSTNADEEKIQMHADKLYHRMMDYEAAVDEAKATNQPVPPLSSVFNPNKPAPSIEEINLPPKMEKSLKKPLHELPPHERELAARAILQEAKLAQVYADDFFKYTTTLNEDRKERQRWLVNALGETVGKFLIPDPPEEHKIKSYGPDELDREIWSNDSESAISRNNKSSSNGRG